MDKIKKVVLGNINLVLALVGVLILIVSYLAGFQKLSTLNSEMSNKLSERTAYLTQLKDYFSNISKYRKGVSDAKADIEKNLKRLPCGIEDEDFLLYLIDVNKSNGAKLASVTFKESEGISDFETIINDKMTPVSGFRATTTSTTTFNYGQFKNFLKFVYDENKPITFVDSVSVTASKEDSSLNAVFILSKYYIDYEGAQYQPVKAPDVPLGKKDLFGTN